MEKPSQRVREWLRALPPDAIVWFDKIAPKNPLLGSDSGRNTNSILVQIGRRLAVETIIEAAAAEREQKKTQPFTPLASELAGKITK